MRLSFVYTTVIFFLFTLISISITVAELTQKNSAVSANRRDYSEVQTLELRKRRQLHQKHVVPIVIDGILNHTYSNDVNATVEFIYQFTYTEDANETQALTIRVNSLNASRAYPLLFVVRQPRGVSSWQLPFTIETANGVQEYSSVTHTLCPLDSFPLSDISNGSNSMRVVQPQTEQDFFLSVSTSDPSNVTFDMTVTLASGFNVRLEEERTFIFSPAKPQYYQFIFPKDVETVLLIVSSTDESCMSVAVQNMTCAAFDFERNIKYEGMWQTTMNKSGMTIDRVRFPDGFFVVFTAKADDYECTGSRELPPPTRQKFVSFVIKEKTSRTYFLIAVLGALGIFIIFYLSAFVTFCVKCARPDAQPTEPSLLERQDRPTARLAGYGSIGEPSTLNRRFESSHSLGSSLDETEIDMLPDAFYDKDVFRTKTFLFVADLARKSPSFHAKKSQLYLWTLITVTVFYALPVLQLVITYQRIVNDTGDQDLCYYNFLCAHPLAYLTDFNHVYSNIGYIMLGVLFCIMVLRRDVLRRSAINSHDRLEKYYGVPQHFGLFYAMGLALIMEGTLSACYHICPTHSNYQFDTTFMYCIAILCMLKIYQNRHPDIYANAYAAFAVLALAVFMGVISIFQDSVYFWIAFSVLHLLGCIALSAQVYYMGRWSLDLGIFKRIYIVFWNDLQAGPRNWFRPMYVDRMILLIMGNLANVGLTVYGFLTRPSDFASYILAIFITNLMLYTTFYIIMKLRSKERILPEPMFYIILSMVSWGSAMYFFINKATTWRMSAAESRLYNQECMILGFYDQHDVWHFLSAISLFLSFLILLTLDDDLRFTPRDKIAVF